MASTQDLLKHLRDFEEQPSSRVYELRLSLAAIIIRNLKEKNWTQRQLADVAGMKESFVTRILHSDSNCTFDVAGRLLFALNVHAEFVEAHAAALPTARRVESTFSGSVTASWKTQGASFSDSGKLHGKTIETE